MKKYTVLSFNFNGYDKIREPKIIDPEAEYIFITDRKPPEPSQMETILGDTVTDSKWDIRINPTLANTNPIYASYYVRYHPFEFASTDTVVVVDASIQINDSLAPIVEAFLVSNADYSPMINDYKTDEDKMRQFRDRLRRVTQADVDEMAKYIASVGQTGWRGTIGCAFAIFKKTSVASELLSTVWAKLLELGYSGIPNRMDEIVLHKELYAFAKRIRLFITSIQMVQSTYMTYCKHNSNEPIAPYANYDQMYYICNMPVSPFRFSKEFNYPTSYRYRTEAMLLTKHLNPDDLKEWLEWHVNGCGFDRIHIFDNESDYDVRKVCEPFGERVTYELIEGHPRQYKLYDEYVNWKSQAEWIVPIDDDEYLDIREFNNVSDAIRYYEEKFPHLGMLAVRWKHLFPKDFHEERSGRVLEYCTEEDPELARKFMHLGDNTVKTFIKRNGPVHYEETWENPAGGHVPKHKCFYGALTCDGKTVVGCGIGAGKKIDDERIRILHCRYKGPDEWMRLNGERFTVSDAIPRIRSMPTLEELAEWRTADG